MSDPSLIVYDGDCIFCQNYVRFARLRKSVGPVELLDARSKDPRLAQFWKAGYDLNEGMIFAHNGQVYYGADAVNVLATLSSNNKLFNKLNAAIFSSPRTSKALYPFLKFGRRMTLLVRGRKLIDQNELLES